jgi:hypothetical protein
VDALPAQPCCFVEAVRGSGRCPQLPHEPQARALRRCSSKRELKENGFVDPERPPAEHQSTHPLVEGARPRRLVDLDDDRLDRADPRHEDTAIELGEPNAPPPPGGSDERRRYRSPPKASITDCEADRAEESGPDKRSRGRHAADVRERKADAERADEDVRETQIHVTGSRVPSAGRACPHRCPAPPRALRRNGRDRGLAGSRGSSAPSPGRFRAARRALPRSPC